MTSPNNLVSVSQIAAALGRSPVAVYNAIERLKIEPALVSPSRYKYYSPDQIDTLRESMRQPNTVEVS